MSDDKNQSPKTYLRRKNMNNGVSSGVYGLAFIGALIYYFQHATSFWSGMLGFFKALLWPAVLIYKVLEYLKM